MPLIKPRANRVRTVRHISRLQEPNRDVLLNYARFIGETVDYVLNQVIDATLARDREFLAWRAEQDTTRAQSDASLANTAPVPPGRSETSR